MIAKSTRIALEVVAGVVAVVVLLGGVAVWRLSSGPVQLDFLTPHIEAALADPQGGLAFEVGSTELTWAAERRSIDFLTRDVRVRGREGSIVAVLPKVAVQLSLRALLHGTIAPTSVEAIGVSVRLVRGPDGNFRVHREAAAEGADPLAESDFSEVLPSVVQQLMSEPQVDQPLTFLTTFRIVDGQVWVSDQRLKRIWRAPLADIELRRDVVGLSGQAALTVDLGDSRAKLNSRFLYDGRSDRVSLSGEFSDVRTEAVISLLPRLQAFSGLTLALDGSLSMSFGLDGTIDNLRFEMTGADGGLAMAGTLPEPLLLHRVSLNGTVDGPGRRIDVELGGLHLGTAEKPGPELSARAVLMASAAGFGGDLDIEAEATLAGLPAQRLTRLWPDGVGGGGRQWVAKNIPRGVIDEVTAKTTLHIPGGDGGETTELRHLSGTLRFRDLEVHYLRPMPPVGGLSGTAVFDQSGIIFKSKSGALGNLTISGGEVEVTGFAESKETIRVDADIGGPLREALELLDHERLGLIRKLGIDAAATDGQVATHIKMRFPVHVPTTFDNLDIAASAKLDQVAIRDFVLGQSVSEGRLDLTVDKSTMEMRGPLRFADTPMEILWNEVFDKKATERTTIEAKIPRIDEAGRKALGLDLAPYLVGPVAAEVAYRNGTSDSSTLRAVVELEDAGLAVDALSWAKPPGRRGQADVSLTFEKARLTKIERIDIDAGTLRATGSGRFDETGKKIAVLAFDELAFDNTRLSKVDVRWRDDALDVQVSGGVLDVERFMNGDDDGTTSKPKVESSPESRVFTPLTVSAPQLDALYFGADRWLEAAAVDLKRARHGWERIGLSGQVPKRLWSPERKPVEKGQASHNPTERPGEAMSAEASEPPEEKEPAPPPDPGPRIFRIDFGPRADGRYGFLVEANDLGAALRALNQNDTIHGGRLRIEGSSEGPMPRYPLEARIEAHDYIMLEAPALARLLTVASLTGISDLLSGEGVRFDRLVSEFTIQDGIVETDLVRAYGSALGITGQGKIDFNTSEIALRGTLVPAYSVNRILGEIPLLGPILTGGKGEGFFAVTYKMSGDLEDPKVSVNPLSALAPGFLRGLFDAPGGESDDSRPRAFPERTEP